MNKYIFLNPQIPFLTLLNSWLIWSLCDMLAVKPIESSVAITVNKTTQHTPHPQALPVMAMLLLILH